MGAKIRLALSNKLIAITPANIDYSIWRGRDRENVMQDPFFFPSIYIFAGQGDYLDSQIICGMHEHMPIYPFLTSADDISAA